MTTVKYNTLASLLTVNGIPFDMNDYIFDTNSKQFNESTLKSIRGSIAEIKIHDKIIKDFYIAENNTYKTDEQQNQQLTEEQKQQQKLQMVERQSVLRDILKNLKQAVQPELINMITQKQDKLTANAKSVLDKDSQPIKVYSIVEDESKYQLFQKLFLLVIMITKVLTRVYVLQMVGEKVCELRYSTDKDVQEMEQKNKKIKEYLKDTAKLLFSLDTPDISRIIEQ